MQKTSIEWVRNPDGSPGYTFNPITGCLNGCEYCYARKLAYGRLKPLYLANNNLAPLIGEGPTPYHTARLLDALDPFYPRFWEERLEQVTYFVKHPTHKGIFVCDMGELFGDWVPREWQEQIFDVIQAHPWHRFYLLTKQPQNLPQFSPFPENCWVGVTTTSNSMAEIAQSWLKNIEAQVKYLSIEPMLHRINTQYIEGSDWVIIGACTGTLEDIKQVIYHHPGLEPMPLDGSMRRWTAQPKIEWVEEIELVARKAGIPIFEKDNLKPLLKRELTQELPR